LDVRGFQAGLGVKAPGLWCPEFFKSELIGCHMILGCTYSALAKLPSCVETEAPICSRDVKWPISPLVHVFYYRDLQVLLWGRPEEIFMSPSCFASDTRNNLWKLLPSQPVVTRWAHKETKVLDVTVWSLPLGNDYFLTERLEQGLLMHIQCGSSKAVACFSEQCIATIF